MLTLNFLVTSLIVILVPGTGVLYTVSVGIGRGQRASAWAALGCTLGILPHLLATVLGLATLWHLSAQGFQLLKWAGVAYLFYLAFSLARSPSALLPQAEEGAGRRTRAGHILLRGFLLNVLNPKLSLFFLAFLPQFLPAHTADPLVAITLLSGVFMAMTLVVFLGYGWLAHGFRRGVLQSARVQNWLRRGFATAFAAMGVQLALAERAIAER